MQTNVSFSSIEARSFLSFREALCGKTRLSLSDLAPLLYTDEAAAKPRGARAVGFLLDLLAEWPEARLRSFLRLLTGLSVIPLGGLRNPDASPKDMIKVVPCFCTACKKDRSCIQLPTVSTCFFVLRLPGCETKGELGRRLQLAMDYGGVGFGAV